MKQGRKNSDGMEILERVAQFRVLGILVGVLAFGFSVTASTVDRAEPPLPESVGAADLTDINGAGAEYLQESEPELVPPPDQGLFYVVYRVVKGDTISEIASRYDITTDSIVTFNNITNARTLSIGKYLKIPTLNGILYAAKKGDTALSLAASYEISSDRIKELNGIGDEQLQAGRNLFLPDARLSSWALREISGDLFKWPLHGWITSWYGWRKDPFSGDRSFHTGIDIGANRGT